MSIRLASFALALALPALASAQGSVNVHLSCPPFRAGSPPVGNDPAAPQNPHSLVVNSQDKVTCQVQLATNGVVSNLALALALPTTGDVTLVSPGTLPDGLPSLADGGILNPLVVDWGFGSARTRGSNPAPNAPSGYAPGTWDEATRTFRWSLAQVGSPGSAATLELRVEFYVPTGLPPGRYSGQLTGSIGGSPLASAARTVDFVVPSRPQSAASASTPPNTRVGGTMLFGFRVGGSSAARADPQTNARFVAHLPYWDPAAQMVKGDASFSAAAGHVPLVDFSQLEAKLLPNEGSLVEYRLPAGASTGPVATGFNDGRLVRVNQAANLVEAVIGTIAFPFVTDWNVLVKAPMKVPAGVTNAQLVGKRIASTGCLRSDQTPSLCTPVDSPIQDPSSPLLTPGLSVSHLGSNGAGASCESSPLQRGDSARTVVSLQYRSADPLENFALAVQAPGFDRRAGNIERIFIGNGAPGIYDTDVFRLFDVAVSNTASDYSSEANLLLRTVPSASASWRTCARSQLHTCSTTELDALGTRSDFAEVRFSAPLLDHPLWRHAKSTSPSDSFRIDWVPNADARTHTIDGTSCSATRCTGAGFCTTAAIQSTGVTVAKTSTTSEVSGLARVETSSGARARGDAAGVTTAFSVARSPLERGSFIVALRNSGLSNGIYGPFTLEMTLPPNAEPDWSDVVPSAGRTARVELYGPGTARNALAGSVAYTATPLGDGTGRVRVRLVVNRVDGLSDVAQVDDGKPVLFGSASASSGSVNQLAFNVRVILLPGVPQIAAHEDTSLKFFADLDGTGIKEQVVRYNTTAGSRVHFLMNDAPPALALTTLPAGPEGAPGTASVEVPPESRYGYELALDNSGYANDGSVRPAGARGAATAAVLFHRLPRESDSAGTPRALTPDLVEASAGREPEFNRGDVLAIWVHADDLAQDVFGGAYTLAQNGWVSCALADANGDVVCTGNQARAALGGRAPRWIAFEVGEALVTDALPRGRRALGTESRINRPYRAKVVVSDPGSPRGSRLDTHSLVASATTLTARGQTVSVVILNGAPQLTPVPPQRVNEAAELTFEVAVRDPNKDAVDVSPDLATLPEGAVFDSQTRTFRWTPDHDQSGTYDVRFVASDGLLEVDELVRIDVVNTNRAPTLALLDQVVAEGSTLGFAATTTDPDQQNVTVTVAGLPKGMTFDEPSRRFAWAPLHGQAGTYRIVVTATDPEGASVTTEIDVTVTADDRGPRIDPLVDRVVHEGEELVVVVTGRDPDGEPVAFELASQGTSPGMSFDADTGVFRWTPGADDEGEWSLTFRVHANGATAETGMVVTVADVNRPPRLDALTPPAGVEGSLLTFTVTATDPDLDAVSFDAEGLPAGAALDAATGVFTWTPSLSQAGAHSVRVLAIDARGGVDMQTLTLHVGDLDAPPELVQLPRQVVREGELLAFVVLAGDPDGDPVAVEALELPTGAAFDSDVRSFTWRPGYDDAGLVHARFSARARDLVVEGTVEIEVVNVNRPLELEPQDSRSILTGEQLSVTFGALDPDGDAPTCSTDTLPDGAAFDVVTRTLQWTPRLDQTGTWTIGWHCTDGEYADHGTLQIEVTTSPFLRAGGGLMSCASSGGGWMLLLGLLVFVRRRRAVVAVVVSCATIAGAEEISGGTDIQRFHPDPAPNGGFATSGGETLGRGAWSVGVIGNQARNPLVVIEHGERTAATVSSNTTTHVTGAVGVLDGFELRFALPVVVAQEGNDPRLTSLASRALGDLRLGARIRLLTQWKHGVALSLTPGFTVPLGGGRALAGEQGATFTPEISLSRRFGMLTAGGALGYRSRPAGKSLSSLALGDEISVRASAGLRPVEAFEAIVEVNGGVAFSSLGDGTLGVPLEALAGARVHLGGSVAIDLAAGGGLLSGPGSPDLRVVTGLRFGGGLARLPVASCVREEASGTRERVRASGADTDGDGLDDLCDLCPNEAEAVNGYRDGDGCFDADTDGDSVYDDLDKCPKEPGRASTGGCPDTDGDGVVDRVDECLSVPGVKPSGCPDSDGDGVLDRRDQCEGVVGIPPTGCPDGDDDGLLDRDDQCPTEPGFPPTGCPDFDGDGLLDRVDACPKEMEDADGFQDEDGCPEADNDGDGFLDVDDFCPNSPEDRDDFRDWDGCADPDNDGDGVPDAKDKCPTELETINGIKDGDGCPDSGVGLVVFDKERFKITEDVRYAGTSVTSASDSLLAQVALTLQAHPEVVSLAIQVRAPKDADKELNVAYARAKSVMSRLVAAGVDASRLTAESEPPDVDTRGQITSFVVRRIVYVKLPDPPAEGVTRSSSKPDASSTTIATPQGEVGKLDVPVADQSQGTATPEQPQHALDVEMVAPKRGKRPVRREGAPETPAPAP